MYGHFDLSELSCLDYILHSYYADSSSGDSDFGGGEGRCRYWSPSTIFILLILSPTCISCILSWLILIYMADLWALMILTEFVCKPKQKKLRLHHRAFALDNSKVEFTSSLAQSSSLELIISMVISHLIRVMLWDFEFISLKHCSQIESQDRQQILVIGKTIWLCLFRAAENAIRISNMNLGKASLFYFCCQQAGLNLDHASSTENWALAQSVNDHDQCI